MSIMRNAGAIAKPLGYKSQLEKNLEALEKEEKEQKEDLNTPETIINKTKKKSKWSMF